MKSLSLSGISGIVSRGGIFLLLFYLSYVLLASFALRRMTGFF